MQLHFDDLTGKCPCCDSLNDPAGTVGLLAQYRCLSCNTPFHRHIDPSDIVMTPPGREDPRLDVMAVY